MTTVPRKAIKSGSCTQFTGVIFQHEWPPFLARQSVIWRTPYCFNTLLWTRCFLPNRIDGLQPIPIDWNDKRHDLCVVDENKRLRLINKGFRPPVRRLWRNVQTSNYSYFREMRFAQLQNCTFCYTPKQQIYVALWLTEPFLHFAIELSLHYLYNRSLK